MDIFLRRRDVRVTGDLLQRESICRSAQFRAAAMTQGVQTGVRVGGSSKSCGRVSSAHRGCDMAAVGHVRQQR